MSFVNNSFGQALPATEAQPDIDAIQNGLLNGVTGITSQSWLQYSLPPMPPVSPTTTLDGLGLNVRAVPEPNVADGGQLNFAYPAFADTPVTPQETQLNIGAFWDGLLNGATGMPGQPQQQYPFPALDNAPAAPQVTQRRNSETGRARNICRVCLREFTRPSSLITHSRSHTGEKPYPCNYPGCFKRFSVLSNQRRHSKIHANPGLPRDPRSHYMAVDILTGRIMGYRRYSDPLN